MGRVIRRQTKQTPPAVSPATLKRQDRFLEAFIKTDGSIVKSAKMARAQHYHWKTNDPDYIQRFKEAEDLLLHELVSEAIERARKSDRLLIFLLKTRFPEIYGDRMKLEGTLGPDEATELFSLLTAAVREEVRDSEILARIEARFTRLVSKAPIQLEAAS